MDIHVMGSDQRSVRCARVSFGKDETSDPDRDKRLLRYLFVHRHASPFEHNIIAFQATKKEWLAILEKIDNPSIQIYYSGGYIWMNLRNAINASKNIPKEVFEEVKRFFPTTLTIVEKGGKISDEDLSALPYSTDRVFLQEKRTTSSGWIGLVDRLELGTEMDYYTFIVECPLFVARQWHRHRFGTYNEILTEPKNSLIKQYTKLFELDGVSLEFTEDAIKEIAKEAIRRKTGARGLRAIMEEVMMDIMFEIPSMGRVKKVIVDIDTVKDKKRPKIIYEKAV